MNEGEGKCFQNKQLPLPSCYKKWWHRNAAPFEMRSPHLPCSHRVLWRPSPGSANKHKAGSDGLWETFP